MSQLQGWAGITVSKWVIAYDRHKKCALFKQTKSKVRKIGKKEKPSLTREKYKGPFSVLIINNSASIKCFDWL